MRGAERGGMGLLVKGRKYDCQSFSIQAGLAKLKKKALAMWASGFKFLLAHKKIHSPTSFECNQDNFKVQNLILIERQLM